MKPYLYYFFTFPKQKLIYKILLENRVNYEKLIWNHPSCNNRF